MSKRKKKAIPGAFVAILHSFIAAPAFMALSGSALRLLILVAAQYHPKKDNNGALVCTDSFLIKFGWKGGGQTTRALKELIDAKLLVCTREGNFHRTAWYALPWFHLEVAEGLDMTNAEYLRDHYMKFQDLQIGRGDVRKKKT